MEIQVGDVIQVAHNADNLDSCGRYAVVTQIRDVRQNDGSLLTVYFIEFGDGDDDGLRYDEIAAVYRLVSRVIHSHTDDGNDA